MSKYYSIPPKLYDNQFWWKKNDIEFWKSLFIVEREQTILEFAAGTGRLAVPLIREGLPYFGVELSAEYVDYAHTQHNLKSIICGDMRSIDLHKTFDRLFIGFNSFAHLLNPIDVSLFFDTVKRHMHKKSHFYIDVFVPHPSFLYRNPDKKEKIIDFFDTDIQEDVSITETLQYDNISDIIYVRWEYTIKQKNSIYRIFEFQMKAYYPDTMNRLLVDAGLTVLETWGDYEHSLLTENSNIQIYKCSL